MKSIGVTFLISGAFLISLSGLERIIIYASLNERAGDYQTLKLIVPSEIWNITQLTLIFGIVISVIGLILLLWKFIVKQSELIKESIRQFEIKHGLNIGDKE
jgi:hypothetical protein